MYQDEYQQPVVIDNGSYQCKAGFAGDDGPRTCFPCFVGKPKVKHYYGMDKDYYIDNLAFARQSMLKFFSPFENGVITNYEYMEQVWHYAYEQLGVVPEDHNILITEAPLVSLFQREKISKIFFETLNVPQFQFGISPLLTLYAYGRTTGLVIDSGADSTYVAPIHEGHYIPQRVEKLPLAGYACNRYLVSLLQMEEVFINNWLYVGDMKEKLCYVANNYEEEIKKCKQSSAHQRPYDLPDGFQCPEIFFKPQLYNADCETLGLSQLTQKAIMKCEADLRKDLYGNIVFSGGSTMLLGIFDRLNNDLIPFVPENIKLKFNAAPERRLSVFIGGSILAELSSFKPMWITRKEYDEVGKHIVHMKRLK